MPTSSLAGPDMPPLDSFSRLTTAESVNSIAKRNAMSGPRLDNAGRLHYGSIYYDEMQERAWPRGQSYQRRVLED